METRKAAFVAWWALLIVGISPALAESQVVQVSESHYTGTWLEIGRTPMFITDGCVAGFTTYGPGDTPDEVAVVDGCYEDNPSGKLKTIKGKGRIMCETPGSLSVSHHVQLLGPLQVA